MTKIQLGHRSERLVVIGEAYKVRNDGVKVKYYVCRCDCGVEKIVHESGIRKGRTKSCGCLKKEVDAQKAKTMGDSNTRHGMSRSRIYRIWNGMCQRCDNPKARDFEHYGGRGVTYDPCWKDFEAFYKDMHKGYSDKLTIERIDVNGNYTKDNCTWITMKAQQTNKRNSPKNRK